MTTKALCFKYLAIHLVGFIGASFLAGLSSNLILTSLPVASENIQFTVKGIISASLVWLAFVTFNKIQGMTNSASPALASTTSFTLVLLAVCSIIALVAALYGLDLYLVQARQSANEILFVLAALFCQSLSQEILFRGILFRAFSLGYSALTVAILLSIAFALLNILVDGTNLMPLLAALLSCFILCLLFTWRQSLVLNALVNTSWLYVTFLTGVLDEHWRGSSPLITRPHGNVMLSGGKFGPESSIFGIILLAAFAVWLYKVYLKAPVANKS